MAPQLIYYYLVCEGCRDPMLLEGWRTPQAERPKGMADVAIKTMYIDFDPEEPKKEIGEASSDDKELSVLHAIASLEDLCGPREKYDATTRAGKHGSSALREKLRAEFKKYVEDKTPFCPCAHCHKELRTPGWDEPDVSAVHDACVLM